MFCSRKLADWHVQSITMFAPLESQGCDSPMPH